MSLISLFRKGPTPASKDRTPFFTAVCAIIVCLLLGFFVFFPTEELRRRINHEIATKSPVPVSLEQLSLAFPLGLKSPEVLIQPAVSGLPAIILEDVRISPAWSSLFGADQALSLGSRLLGGALNGTLSRKGTARAQISDARIEWPLPSTSLKVSALIQKGYFEGRELFSSKGSTSLNLTLKDTAFSGLKAIGATEDRLPLGEIVFEGAGQSNRFKITTLTARGGRMEGAGSGDLILGATPASSRINLTLNLRTAAGFDPGLADLLALVAPKQKDGSYRLQINGPLAQ